MSHRILGLVGLCLAACLAPGAASAQANDAQVAALGAGLLGGDDRSYGYGREQREEDGPVIDLRRRTGRVEAVADLVEAPLDEEPQEAPPSTMVAAAPPAPQQSWLEQEQIDPPYQAEGRWYVPTAEPGYEQTGQASWYGADFHDRRTANGEVFDQSALTAAHPTLPMSSLVQVTNLENGREVILRINDRGPFTGGRLIDVSRAAADALGFVQAGEARVHVRYLGPAPRRAALSAEAAEGAGQGPSSLLPAASSDPAPRVQTTPAPAAGAGYFVQLGAFADLSNAHRVRDAAAAVGPTIVDVRTTANGELFRVRLGPWGSREEAEAARARVAALGYAEALVAAP